MRSLTVPPGSPPVRLDLFLTRHILGCSRRSVQRAIANGDVRVNRHRARKGHSVGDGDVVAVPDELCEPAALQPNPALTIPVLYESPTLIAVDKPAGMPSHALRAGEMGTAANFLLARHPELAAVGKRGEAGVVHRLDTETSGVLLAARTEGAYRLLREQFSSRTVIKEYVALVDGAVAAPGVIRTWIAHDPRNRRRMHVVADSARVAPAREAVTHYLPVESLRGATLLRVRIATGVMHQIRVHLASIGHPVLGDRLYGRGAATSPPRQLLHACRLVVADPSSGAPVEVNSPIPTDFAAYVEALRQKRRASTGSTREARRRSE